MVDRASDDDAAEPVLRLWTCADPRHIAWLRQHVRSFLDAYGASPDLVDDLELVVSELATNAIRHTDTDDLSVRVTGTDGHWTLDVADAEDLTALDDLTLPPPHVPDGRGLYIVAALVDEITTVETDGRWFIRCRRGEGDRSSTS